MSTPSRILHEKRAWIVGLIALALLDVGLYVAGVLPLRARVASMDDEAQRARTDLAQAERQLALAEKTVTGKSRAADQLRKFYEEVLPPDQAGARRVTHLDLAKLARKVNLQVDRKTQIETQEKGSTLVRLDSDVVLQGGYADVREFLFELETAPEFVVINDVELAQRETEGSTLVLTLSISTYYRAQRGR
jgi:Tfp pilus assembly protein PilO